MDMEKNFHMKGGLGDTSYSMNSSLQKRVADKVKHITLESIQEMYSKTAPEIVSIADLGCSSGPNTLSNIKDLVCAVEIAAGNMARPVPEFRVALNDLPTNDFNTIFQALPDLYRELKIGAGRSLCVYIGAYPGTFYGRLFPTKSLHFVYSSNSLHWLSKVPPGIYDKNGETMNKGSLYISVRSPPQVVQAYLKQFQEDFSLFLKSRSEELMSGGRMVLVMLGRRGSSHADRETSLLWELLYQSLVDLANQGELEKEKVDRYEVHFYAPSKEELEDEIRKEGSFRVELMEAFEMGKDRANYGKVVTLTVRSIQESMLAHHFGETILDKLFEHYGRLIDEHLAKEDIKSISRVMVLTKL
ncbi:probable methyltransferase TCM_000336 [Andrographis paniculata]|uniref:probable methyltransferase TCM_000336 n=1 Tax=Andrographis paniculata TaxID=175694 RepID=UPI0021E724BB|nr:probable methyltransferase TCM_000336 [Andrographis paniculata]